MWPPGKDLASKSFQLSVTPAGITTATSLESVPKHFTHWSPTFYWENTCHTGDTAGTSIEAHLSDTNMPGLLLDWATNRTVKLQFQSLCYNDTETPAPEANTPSTLSSLQPNHCVDGTAAMGLVVMARAYLVALAFGLYFLPPQNQPETQIPERHGGRNPGVLTPFQPTAGSPSQHSGGSLLSSLLSCLPVSLPSINLRGQPVCVLDLVFLPP